MQMVVNEYSFIFKKTNVLACDIYVNKNSWLEKLIMNYMRGLLGIS